ncbi:unnamed protein product [Closterium sp. Naga37s-1]|nr:unnamed protein product [Closterium sp. Naga37s-1]
MIRMHILSRLAYAAKQPAFPVVLSSSSQEPHNSPPSLSLGLQVRKLDRLLVALVEQPVAGMTEEAAAAVAAAAAAAAGASKSRAIAKAQEVSGSALKRKRKLEQVKGALTEVIVNPNCSAHLKVGKMRFLLPLQLSLPLLLSLSLHHSPPHLVFHSAVQQVACYSHRNPPHRTPCYSCRTPLHQTPCYIRRTLLCHRRSIHAPPALQ